MTPLQLFKCLSDDTRLSIILLVQNQGELCVGELVDALVSSQPKISRHLASLRECQLLDIRKSGQWVFYRINPELPLWANTVIAQTTEHNVLLINQELQRLSNMQNRPDKSSFCK